MDDDGPSKKRIIGPELWIFDFVMSCFLGGIVKDVGNCQGIINVGGNLPLITGFSNKGM